MPKTKNFTISVDRADHAVAEMIALQRRIFERQGQLIESQEAQASQRFARYRNEYLRAVEGYEEESGFGRLCDAIASSRIAYVADYHTLALAQRTFIKMIHGVIAQCDQLCLALEFVDERHQETLDRYMSGRIQEPTFLRRIRYKENWPYDIWPNFKPIFDLAMDLGFPVIAIDSDGSLPLRERDQRAATHIAKAARRYPEATILVYTGQMHVSPGHLPSAVDKAFAKTGLSEPERVIVYQNAQEIYWQLAAARREMVEVVRIDDQSFCVNNTPPLVQQLSYLHWLQYDRELLEFTELDGTVRSLIRSLGRFLGVRVKDAVDKVRIMMPGDLDLVEALEDGGFDEASIRQVLAQVEGQQSACIPKLNLIYLATLSVNHAAEEATHFIKHIVSGASFPVEAKDQFYFQVINEACGFFGSKVINPKRKTEHQGKLRKIVAQARKRKGRRTAVEHAACFALDHLAWERGNRVTKVSGRHLANPQVFMAATHYLGYMLGNRLYYALTSGVIEKKVIRQLFRRPLDGPEEAFEAYMEAAEIVRFVRIPRRI